jgi:hypothetical protein
MLEEITAVKALENFNLYIELDDGRKGVFDTKPYLNKGIFKELQEPAYFVQVSVAYGTVTWPHEQDFSPATIALELKQIN